jgi:translation initiation factor IF-1
MSQREAIELEGTGTEVPRNAILRAGVHDGHERLTTLGGSMRRFRIRVLAGDRVTIAVSPYDRTQGRITFRHKS